MIDSQGRNYYLTPLDIYDTLMAKERKLSISTMIQLAQKKGILLSSQDSRETLARYISSIPFDYGDIEELYNIIETDQRREKTTNSTVRKTISFDSVKDDVDKLNEEREVFGEVYSIVSNPNSPTVIIDAKYRETDFAKARMLQTTKREARIELSPKTKDTLIRFPANEKCNQIVNALISNIEKYTGQNIEVEKVELTNITTPAKRNKFFFSLMNGIEGMPTKDVLSVKMIPMNLEDADEEPEENAQITSLIRRVAIDGQAITASKEYQSLVSKGFFISSIVWQADDTTTNPNTLVELEAGFAVQSECKDFKYSVKGTYAFEKEAGGFSLHRKPASELDRIKYLSLIEKAAKDSLDEVSNDKD
jgi:hypothetical protein